MAELEEPLETLQREVPQEPPVLNVNPSPPIELNQISPQNGVDESDEDTNEVSQPRNIPPTIPGLGRMIDEWQLTGVSEELQFFSTNVC